MLMIGLFKLFFDFVLMISILFVLWVLYIVDVVVFFNMEKFLIILGFNEFKFVLDILILFKIIRGEVVLFMVVILWMKKFVEFCFGFLLCW